MLRVAVCYKCWALCIAPRQATYLVRDPHIMLTVGLVFLVWFLLRQRNWLRAHKTSSAAVLPFIRNATLKNFTTSRLCGSKCGLW